MDLMTFEPAPDEAGISVLCPECNGLASTAFSGDGELRAIVCPCCAFSWVRGPREYTALESFAASLAEEIVRSCQ